ncbi:hypothetical protein [Desulfobacca acetoxidans]
MGIVDFLKNLFRPPYDHQESHSCMQPSQAASSRPPASQAMRRSGSGPLQDLLHQVQGKGRPEHPFLHRTYSPSSRVPCADFTPFIIERLLATDLRSIGQLMRGIIEANPGLGTDGGWIEEEVKKVLRVPLEKYLCLAVTEAYLQLRAMWIIASKEGGGREFWLTNDFPLYFAQALSPYDLELQPAMEGLRKKANSFIRKMRKDAPYWLDFPLLKASELTTPPLPPGEGVAQVRRLTIGARLHLFWAVEANGGRLSSLAGHIPRDLGLYTLDSTQEILASGLLLPSQDPALLKNSFLKTELLEACGQAGVTYKKSWNKEKLLQALLSAPPDFISHFIANAGLAAVNPEHADTLQALLARARQLEPVFKVLCFV